MRLYFKEIGYFYCFFMRFQLLTGHIEIARKNYYSISNLRNKIIIYRQFKHKEFIVCKIDAGLLCYPLVLRFGRSDTNL